MDTVFTSPYFGVALSIIAFGIGTMIQRKTKSAMCNLLIIAIVLAVSIYTKFSVLKQYWLPIIVGCTAGSRRYRIGASSHVVCTSKALEIGEIEGAMSGLAIGICGIITVIFSMFI